MLQVLSFIPFMPLITPFLELMFLMQIYYNGKFERAVERLDHANATSEDLDALVKEQARHHYFYFSPRR